VHFCWTAELRSTCGLTFTNLGEFVLTLVGLSFDLSVGIRPFEGTSGAMSTFEFEVTLQWLHWLLLHRRRLHLLHIQLYASGSKCTVGNELLDLRPLKDL
jgi:hypothetical protein